MQWRSNKLPEVCIGNNYNAPKSHSANAPYGIHMP